MRHKKVQQNISRLMALLLCVTFLFAGATVVWADGESGSCGDNLSWSLSGGTLTITGSGAMTDFRDNTMAPWYDLRSEIRTIVLPEGLTHVGDRAFYDCARLTSVDIPDSVTSIGKYAFARCKNIQLLDLSNSLKTIENDAFHGCWALQTLRLPQSLETIGDDAFYNCESLTSVVIPSGVRSLGSAVFAYCTSLVRAEVQTRLTQLPDWTFYGCSRLNTLILPDTVTEMGNAALRNCDALSTVSYGGDSVSMDKLREIIVEEVPSFGSVGFITDENPGSSASSGVETENEDGTVTEQITTVTNRENSSVSSTVDRTFRDDEDDTVTGDITVTIENEDGWEEGLQDVQTALDNLSNSIKPGVTGGSANVTVYIKDSESMDQGFIDSLMGRDVVVTVITKDGSSWKIDCSAMVEEEASGAYNLRYTLEPADEAALELMGVTQGYRLRFLEDASVEAEVMVLLPDSVIRQTVTLFKQERGRSLTQYQSVVVDGAGYAHLYLGSVDSKSDYFLGVNVAGTREEAIIPDTLQEEYPKMDYVEPIRYEVTGRTSSWGMNLGQVMGILAAVMVSVIVIVGAVMFTWNKRRLKKGYVPDFDDEDE